MKKAIFRNAIIDLDTWKYESIEIGPDCTIKERGLLTVGGTGAISRRVLKTEFADPADVLLFEIERAVLKEIGDQELITLMEKAVSQREGSKYRIESSNLVELW